MFTHEGKEGRTVVIRFEPDEDVLVEMQRAVDDLGIKHGTILSCFGAVKSYGMHVVKSTNIPPGNTFAWEDNMPYDIISMTGYVMDGRVHAHVALADRTHMLGGHLEKGMRVLNLAAVTIMELEGMDLTDMDRYSPVDGAPTRRP